MKKLTVTLRDETYKLIKENKCNKKKKRAIIDLILETLFIKLNQCNPGTKIELKINMEITEYGEPRNDKKIK